MPSSWNASLDLRFAAAGDRTVVARRHAGPLQVQKALYPEGGAVCHAIVVHPPGGIAGGDTLSVQVHCGPRAHAVLTTPGATRWYKANGGRATQAVRLEIEGGLEWLPQESIVFDQAVVGSTLDITVAGAAATIGWDVVALGRTAAGERFCAGEFAQTIRLTADGELLWSERTRLCGADALLDSPVGLGGRPVFGCLWAYGPLWSEQQLATLRAELPPASGVTRLAPRLVVARVLAATSAAAREVLQAIWQRARPLVFAGRIAVAPRIWAT